MSNGHHCAFVFGQELLKPFDTLCVKMVRRLIQQNHIMAGKKKLTQRYTTLFSTRENRCLGITRRNTK